MRSEYKITLKKSQVIEIILEKVGLEPKNARLRMVPYTARVGEGEDKIEITTEVEIKNKGL